MRKTSKFTALALASLMLLASCGKKPADGKNGNAGDAGKKEEVGFKIDPVVNNDGTPIKGGTLKVALIASAPFKGIFHEAFANDGIDMNIMGWTMSGFFDTDPDYKFAKTGQGTIEFNEQEKKAVITINDKSTWSDGVPVTAKDFLRYYLIVGSKDYEGIRFGSDFLNVVGMKEYHEGKADTVSGFKIINDKQFEISFINFDSSIYWGKGIAYNPVPDHIYKDIPVKEQEAHDMTRKTPLSCGPYVIKEVVPGQQVIAEANPYYFAGKPKVDKLEFKVVSPEQVVAASQAGEFDIVDGFGSDLYRKFEALNNGSIITNYAGSYNYIAFKLGKWNGEKNEVETNPNAKMADKELRKALAMCIDRNTINEKLLDNLSLPLYQIIPPYFATIYDKNFEGIRFNLEEAKKVLDNAGYKDVNGDGIREDKNGNPLKINFAAMVGGSTQEPIVQFFIQNWKNIGLDVQLTTGRLIEMNSFYEKLMADDPEIDMYMAGWNTGSNPDPTGFYGKKQGFNIIRFTSPQLDQLLDDVVTLDKADGKDNSIPENRLKHYIDVSKYLVADEAVVIPTFAGSNKTWVNKRVKKYDISSPEEGKAPFRVSDVELTADQPIK